ncbi:hypothetical protein CDD83_2216 [Cordyceps sp. RAO-2017]|nr:hypothetical protein CDD83_2216 [Cordyceps sp. RAO-2017]
MKHSTAALLLAVASLAVAAPAGADLPAPIEPEQQQAICAKLGLDEATCRPRIDKCVTDAFADPDSDKSAAALEACVAETPPADLPAPIEPEQQQAICAKLGLGDADCRARIDKCVTDAFADPAGDKSPEALEKCVARTKKST